MNKQTPWQELVDGCINGLQAAQMEVYRRVWREVFPAVCRIIRDKAQAEDVMQESIIKGFNKLSSLREANNYPAWQRRLAVNEALMWWRNNSNHKLVQLNEFEDIQEEEEDKNWEWQQVERQLELLPDGYRLIIQLHVFEQLKHEEIAQMLELAPSTVRSQYSRGIALLKKQLHERQVATYH